MSSITMIAAAFCPCMRGFMISRRSEMRHDYRGGRGLHMLLFVGSLASASLLAGCTASPQISPEGVARARVGTANASTVVSPLAEVPEKTVQAVTTKDEVQPTSPGQEVESQLRAGEDHASLKIASGTLQGGDQSALAPVAGDSVPARLSPIVPGEEKLDDLDATEIAGMKFDKKAIRYLGRRSKPQPVAVLRNSERLRMDSYHGPMYDAYIVADDHRKLFRIQDKQGNVVLDWQMPDPRNYPGLYAEEGIFITAYKTEWLEEQERTNYFGVRVYDMQGRMIMEVPPEKTEEVSLIGTNRHGVIAMNGFDGEKFFGFDLQGNKLWELEPGVSDYLFSADGRYFCTLTRILSDPAKDLKTMDEASLYDIRGNKLMSFRDIPEIAPHFVAISTDSKFAAYLKRDAKDVPFTMYLVDMKDLTVNRTFPISSYPVAISKEARYVAALDMSYDKSGREYVKTLKVFDESVNLLMEMELDRRNVPFRDPSDTVTFANNDTLVKVKYRNVTYYFNLLPKE